eukprot:Phypoly_transcript_19674.p1 GENE.Phypoly_transcript_19674~~Phypoly_transcript_19674.p1  ORF type:complete len:189 (+),score=30.08 Phypoly_transcript_19674:34-567(+)
MNGPTWQEFVNEAVPTYWQRFDVVFQPPSSNISIALMTVGKPIGTLWINRVTLQQGDPHVWTRTFQHAFVALNLRSTPETIQVPAGARRLKGTQDPDINDGSPVTGAITLQPTMGLILALDQIPTTPPSSTSSPSSSTSPSSTSSPSSTTAAPPHSAATHSHVSGVLAALFIFCVVF